MSVPADHRFSFTIQASTKSTLLGRCRRLHFSFPSSHTLQCLPQLRLAESFQLFSYLLQFLTHILCCFQFRVLDPSHCWGFLHFWEHQTSTTAGSLEGRWDSVENCGLGKNLTFLNAAASYCLQKHHDCRKPVPSEVPTVMRKIFTFKELNKTEV